MTTHLVIGASGLIGGHLANSLRALRIDAIGTFMSHNDNGLHSLDVCDEASLMNFVKEHQPKVVFLPAYIANVDYCQLHPDETYKVNVIGVKNVVASANYIGAKIVFFSTDYIFDGLSGPYEEDDLCNPICVYGVQKLIAEHIVVTQAKDYLIIRTNGVFGLEKQRKNFIYRLYQTLKEKRLLRVPQDQVGTPTYAPDLARAVIELVQMNQRGIFHIVGIEITNRYEFAVEAAKVFNLDSGFIRPIHTSELGQIAPRPLRAGLKANKALAVLSSPLWSYRQGLVEMHKYMLDEVIKES